MESLNGEHTLCFPSSSLPTYSFTSSQKHMGDVFVCLFHIPILPDILRCGYAAPFYSVSRGEDYRLRD